MSLYLTLILLFLIVAIFFRVDFVFYIAYLAVGIWLWSRFMIPRLLRKIEIERHFPHRVFWNESFPVKLVIKNSAWLGLPWLQLRESVSIDLRIGPSLQTVVSMRGKETIELEEQLVGKRRGRYAIGPLTASTSDLFGLAPLETITFPEHHVIVYPRLHTLKALGLPSKLPFGTLAAHERLFADPSRPVGVREFRSGDSLRSMNWKVSAHTERLMVRTFQPAVAQEVLILLNLYEADFVRKDRYAYIEWGIELAASLAAHLTEQKQGVVLAPSPQELFEPAAARPAQGRPSDADGEAPRPGRAGIEVILEELAQIQTQTVYPLEDWLPAACRDVQWGTTILIITPVASPRLTEILHQLVRTGRNPVLIICQPLTDEARLALHERGRRLGFSVFYVPRVADLKVWQNDERRLAA